MRVRLGLLGLALAAVLGASVAGASVSAGQPATARLTAFDGCPAFLAYVRKQALPFVGPWGLVGAVGIAAGTPPGAARDAVAGSTGADLDYSQTNVQEEGVDEPDLVKTDGRTLFVASGGTVSALDVRGGRRPRLVDTLRLDRGADELLLEGRPSARPLTGLRRADPGRRHRDPGADPVPVEDRDHGCRRPRSCALARPPDARARRRLSRRPARGARRAARPDLAARARPAVRPARRRRHPRRRGGCDPDESRRRRARPARGAGSLATRCAAVPARWRRRDGSSSAARCRGRAPSPVSAS